MIKTILTPNPVACIIGMIFALIPGYKSLFFTRSSILYCLADASLGVSKAGLVLGQILLGSNLFLMRGKKSLLTTKIIIFTVITKGIVVPGVTMGIIYLF